MCVHAGTQRVDKQETISSLAAKEENRQGGGKVPSRGRSSPMIIAKWEDLAMGVIHFLLALMANGFISLSSTSMCGNLCLFHFPHCLLRIDWFFLSLSRPDVLFLPRLCSLGCTSTVITMIALQHRYHLRISPLELRRWYTEVHFSRWGYVNAFWSPRQDFLWGKPTTSMCCSRHVLLWMNNKNK